MIRILHVVTYMGRGGLETMIMNYYRNIDRTKVQFDFLVHREFEADYDAEILELGGKIYRLPRLNPLSIEYLNQLDHFFATHKEYRIVHSHLDCMSGIPLKIARKNGVPVRIAHAHNSNQARDIKYLVKLFYKRNICSYASDLFACGDEAGRWMFNTEDFVVLNNAIDSKKYIYNDSIRTQMRNKFDIGADTLVIGHVGRFAPQKNHSFIVKVFAEALKNTDNINLLLIGDGELKGKTEELATSLGIKDKIIFTGVRDDVHRLLQAMDCILFPSLHEGLPVSIIEAQAAGLPCFISDKVPIECKKTELVEQLSLEMNAEKWADYILKVDINNRRDTSEEIKQSGFDISENAKWLQNFYIEKSMEKGNAN